MINPADMTKLILEMAFFLEINKPGTDEKDPSPHADLIALFTLRRSESI